MGSHIQSRHSSAKWWTSIDGDCPISLVAIAELQKPLFALPSPGGAPPHYFDARFLGSFLVSSTAFMNPVNRQPLSRSDCMALDTHLRKHHPRDAFDFFAKCGPRSDQAQREATAVLQHLFQFGYTQQQQATGRRTSIAPPLEEAQTLFVGSESFPALANIGGSSRRTARRPGRSVPTRRTRGDHGRTTRALPTPAAVPEQPTLIEEMGMAMWSEPPIAVLGDGGTTTTATAAAMSFATTTTPASRCPEYLQPTRCTDAFMDQVVSEADRDSRIEEEVEALMAIYGEENVSTRRLRNEQGQSCWEIEVDAWPWRLHVLIPSDLPYPFACPLLCPKHEKRTLAAQRIVNLLGEVSQREAGEVFIFSLVEALKSSEGSDSLHL